MNKLFMFCIHIVAIILTTLDIIKRLPSCRFNIKKAYKEVESVIMKEHGERVAQRDIDIEMHKLISGELSIEQATRRIQYLREQEAAANESKNKM